jgi:FkbM family methyltransferase
MTKNFYTSKLYLRLSCFSTTFKTIYRNISGKKFEPDIFALDRIISSGAVCFDIGAAYGRYTLILSRLAGNSGQVYSFEPGSYSYAVLSFVMKFHGLRNVTAVNQALSEQPGKINLLLPIKKTGKVGPSLAHLNTGKESGAITEEVEMTTLDRYCQVIDIPRIDIIKCDVEGAELLVIKGARESINRFKPTILCEIDASLISRFGYVPSDIFDFFSGQDYKPFIFRNNSFREVSEFKENSNYFFIYRDKEKITGRLPKNQ